MTTLIERASSTLLQTRDIQQLAKGLDGTEAAAALAEARRTRDAPAFQVLLMASLVAGHDVDASILIDGASLLPDDAMLAATAGHASGRVDEALVDAVSAGRMRHDFEALALFLAACWSKQKGHPLPDGLVPQARMLCRRAADPDTQAFLVALNGMVDAPVLALLVEPWNDKQTRADAKYMAQQVVQKFVGKPIDAVPKRAVKASTGTTVRATPKLSRNAACHCGSGKKYKRCHYDEDARKLATQKPVLTLDRLLTLHPWELAALDADEVPVELRDEVLRQLGAFGEFAPLPRFADGFDASDAVRIDLARWALAASQPEVARAIVGDRDAPVDVRAALDPDRRLQLLEDAARTELDGPPVDTAFAMLSPQSPWPALGILVARGVIPSLPRADAEALYVELLLARDRLGTADPDDVIASWVGTEDAAITIETLQTRLDTANDELARTHGAMARLEAEVTVRLDQAQQMMDAVELQAAQDAEVVAAVTSADPELKARAARLKEELKERHRERNVLRKELEEARAQLASLEEAHTDVEEEDAEEEVGDDVAPAALRLPRFPEGFREALKQLPGAVGRTTMTRIGQLCASDPLVLREARTILSVPGVWRMKIGRSYRLFFRLSDTEVEVLDLVHRQDLEKKIRKLRQ